MKRDLDDLLRDLRAAGKGKIRVVERDPAENPAAKRDAQALGIQPVQFNVVGKSELQVKEGYLGLAVQYADGKEAIPFVRRTDDLEYRLASAIKGLTRPTKPTVGSSWPWMTGAGKDVGSTWCRSSSPRATMWCRCRWVTRPSRPTRSAP